MKLRADLHSHTNLDPIDGLACRKVVSYSYVDALRAAKSEGIEVLSFTHHTRLIFTREMQSNAKKHGILLIPGFEAVIEGCDVILLNPTTDKITTFEELKLERRRNKHLFVLAPHPFYLGGKSLGFSLLKHIKLFDGIEYCHFHTSWFNVPNWIAIWVARKHKKTIIGTSDSHYLFGFGMTYSIVNVNKKDIKSFICALKSPTNVTICSTCVSFSYLRLILGSFARTFRFLIGIK